MSETIRTLVVDDDPAVLLLHRRYVDAIPGFEVVATAGNGAEAIAEVAGSAIDLVLLDIHLPDVSGVEVLHRLRGLAAHDVDVIVLSSAADSTTVAQALAAGVADYLVKPFSADDVARRLGDYAAGRAARRRDAAPVTGALDQGEIDRMLARATETAPIATVADTGWRLPKGLAEPTAERVLAAVPSGEAAPVADIAATAGVSRITARRYLEQFRAEGRVELSHRYGAPGRPELRYRVAGRPGPHGGGAGAAASGGVF